MDCSIKMDQLWEMVFFWEGAKSWEDDKWGHLQYVGTSQRISLEILEGSCLVIWILIK